MDGEQSRKQRYADGRRVIVSTNSGERAGTVLGYEFSAGVGWRYRVQLDNAGRIYRVAEYQLRPEPAAHE